MNKIFILLIALSFIINEGIAQEPKGGIKGGLNLSYLTLDDANDKNIIPGFHAGVFVKVPVTEGFSLQPEVLYSMKGTLVNYSATIADGESRYNLNYIEVPLYIVFNLSDDFNFHVGPYAAFLLNAKVNSDVSVLSIINVDNEEDLDRDNFNLFDYGLSGGLGFSYEKLELGFNYGLGLQRVVKEDELLDLLLGDSRNSVIQIYLALSF
jgi:hypothetical protein